MLVRQLLDPALAQYAYLVGCPRSGEAIVFDPERDIDRYLDLAAQHGLESREGSTTYYLGRTILTPRGHSELAGWQKRLFCTMSQAGANNPLHFSIPPGRMVELGIQIDL